jgi:hypothetical protein
MWSMPRSMPLMLLYWREFLYSTIKVSVIWWTWRSLLTQVWYIFIFTPPSPMMFHWNVQVILILIVYKYSKVLCFH